MNRPVFTAKPPLVVHPTKQPSVYHFTPTIHTAGFSPGVGIMPRDPPENFYGGPRVHLSIQFPYIDIRPVVKVSVDEAAKVLTLVIDGQSTTTVHPRALSRPVDIDVRVSRPGQIGATYTLLVKDMNGKVLSQSPFPNYLPV